MHRGTTPVTQLRRLRAKLKALREGRGFTQKDVADALEWSSSKVIRIENGPVGISITDLKALLFHYNVTDVDQVEELLAMARVSKQRAWWHKYKDNYSVKFLTFLGLESSAIRIKQVQQMIVPGLLQTPAYAAALLESYGNPSEVIERGLAVRMERQQVLMNHDGPEMLFILDESVLHRRVGDDVVMRGQLLHLKQVASRPNVRIQVVPFQAGFHRGLASSFEIFQLTEQVDDYAMIIELPYRDVLIEESSEETMWYVDIFAQLERLALRSEESMLLVDCVLENLPG